MTSKTITIAAANGLHARPVSELVKLVKTYPVKVTLATEVKSANAASMLAVLALGLKKDTVVTISADGQGEEDAVNAVADFILSVKE